VRSEIEDTHCNTVQAWSPILLSGDTGTGKTYILFKYLELLRSSGAVELLSNDVSIFTLSAKFIRSNVEKMGSKIRDTISKAHGCLSQDEPRTFFSFILDEVT
jgi:nucleoside-triphosphatase THEP1